MTKLLNRRIWVICDLIDKSLRQRDIRELWGRRGEIQYKKYEEVKKNGKSILLESPDVWKPKKFKSGLGISKGELSKIISGDPKNNRTGLKQEGIIEGILMNNGIGYRLVENYEALYKILVEFSKPELPKIFKIQIMKDLMNSKYAKKVINMDLVNKIRFKKDSDLNSEEKEFVLAIIQNSPSALLKVLNHIRRKWEEIVLENEKKDFIMELQNKFYNDVVDNTITEKVTYFPMPMKVEFKIETSIKFNDKELNYSNTFEKSSLEFLLEEEKQEENKKIENMLGNFEKEQNKIQKQIMEEIDRPFDLITSPLTYEK